MPTNLWPTDEDTFQSVGACTKTCTEDYAFGIVQGGSCWCSNVAPNSATNVDLSKCNDSCPGYPDDDCGNESDGLFGYIVMMGHKASSTAAAPSSTGTSVSQHFRVLVVSKGLHSKASYVPRLCHDTVGDHGIA